MPNIQNPNSKITFDRIQITGTPKSVLKKKVSNNDEQKSVPDIKVTIIKVEVNLPASSCFLACRLSAERSAPTWQRGPGSDEKWCSSPLWGAQHSCEKPLCYYVIITHFFQPMHYNNNTFFLFSQESLFKQGTHKCGVAAPSCGIILKSSFCKHSRSRFVVSVWLEAGVPSKVSRSSGFHNVTLLKDILLYYDLCK